jgi:hypothetical protein
MCFISACVFTHFSLFLSVPMLLQVIRLVMLAAALENLISSHLHAAAALRREREMKIADPSARHARSTDGRSDAFGASQGCPQPKFCISRFAGQKSRHGRDQLKRVLLQQPVCFPSTYIP